MHAAACRWIATLFACLVIGGGSAASAQTTRLGPQAAQDDADYRGSSRDGSSRTRTWPISFSRAESPAERGDSSPPATDKPLPLAPRKERKTDGVNRPEPPSASRSLTTIFSSLALVLGLFFLVVWCTRRAMPQRSATLPKEVVEVLGRAPLQGRQQMQLVRFGNKLVLLAISANGAETLSEVTDADEVLRLSALCLESQPNSASATFRQILSQLGREPAPRGFVGDDRRADADMVASGSRRTNREADDA